MVRKRYQTTAVFRFLTKRGVDMIAAVPGPMVKTAAVMCSHKIAWSANDMV